ncbi:MAG: fumarylacetoacetate hydrolase family protein [Alphaproteobacteria bacterium]|nr:fumarylacetoacetate hydrolase family protein [Alphaproteobacteria bacterium]
MGMLEEIRVHRLVERLLADRADGTAYDGAWDKSLTPQTMVEAYRVQDSIIRRMRSRGTEPGGWRIALTTDAAQKQHDIVHPIVGPIWRQDVLSSPSTLPESERHSPEAGAELALRIGKPMGADDGPWDRESVAGCVGAVALAIGIFDDRHVSGLAEYTIGLGIADLAGSAACVLGQEIDDLKVLDCDSLEFRTALDEREVGVASTSAYLAHPYEILSWVATHLNVRRRQLEPGDVVLLGCPGEPFPLGSGDQITVTNDALGTVTLALEGQPTAAQASS